MKPSLLLAGLLLLASSAQAQHSHLPNTGGSGIGLGNGQGNWGYGWGSSSFGSSGRPVHYENPRSFSVEYARNDGPFVPSTFMSYEEAVTLGQQQIAAAAKAEEDNGALSLGEVARSLRTGKIPTLKLRTRVLQDSSGRLEVCNLNGNDCHRP
jgi:hypothetical protein